jgi:hypothetical protein
MIGARLGKMLSPENGARARNGDIESQRRAKCSPN